MPDDFEIELESDQPAEQPGSEAQITETPAENGEKQTEASAETGDKETFEEASEKESEAPKEPAAKVDTIDDDIDSWAEKAGHEKPETEKERKLLQKLRDSQREFTKGQQAKKGTDQIKDVIRKEEEAAGPKKDDATDPIEKRLAAVEADRIEERTLRLRSEFFTANTISDSTSQVMADIFKEKVALAGTPEAKQRVIDYWSDPAQLQDWLDLAQARESKSSDKESIASEAAKNERERIAREQNASGVNRSAKSTVTKDQDSALDKLWKED